jgi:pyruvate/2-oxoglutarate dehydrogenase complex dihydrolipoamide dehydrogenase (E3) component
VGKIDMTGVPRAVEKGEAQGFMKVYVEKESLRILGAAILGTGGDESVHSLIDAIYSRIPCTEFQAHVRIHPTVSELLPTAMERLKPL